MKAAVVREAGHAPVFSEFKEPSPENGEVVVRVAMAALSPLTKSRAAGAHYSSREDLPFVPGVDGVGTLDDGRRAYFVLPRSPFGAMAEKTVVDPDHCIVLPNGIDDATAAAIANPGMSSWAALTERARFKRGECVLINGATGAAGTLAVQIARHLGARKVIATGRNTDVLKDLVHVGADVTVSFGDDHKLETLLKEQFREGVDVVLDYLWGSSAEAILLAAARAGKDGVPIRYIQIGSVSGGTIQLPSAILRSTAIQMMGSGIGSIALPKLIEAIAALLEATANGFVKIKPSVVPLENVEMVWNDSGRDRVVFKV